MVAASLGIFIKVIKDKDLHAKYEIKILFNMKYNNTKVFKYKFFSSLTNTMFFLLVISLLSLSLYM